VRQAGTASIRQDNSILAFPHTFPGGWDVRVQRQEENQHRPSLLSVCIPGIVSARVTLNRARLHRCCRFPHLAKQLIKASRSRALGLAVEDIAVHSAFQIVLDGGP
jgi:hypothetical protein